MKILITGAGGLIGSHTLRAFSHSDHEVIALFRNANSISCHHNSMIIEGDILHVATLNLLKSEAIDAIVHCAAVLPGQFGTDEAERAANINRQIDQRMIEFCQVHRCHLIYISTTSVYGFSSVLCDERSVLWPLGPYVIEKIKTEQRILKANIPFVILRICAPYAPMQRSNTVLKIYIENALNDRDLYYHGSGKRQQDFTAAEDVAEAICCAVQNDSSNGIFNIAGGNPISMKDLAKFVLQCVPESKSRVFPSGHADPQESYLAMFNINKAKKILHWQPSISLEQGIKKWIKYMGYNP